MVSRVMHTTFDCSNAYALSEWWKPVLGYTDLPDDPNAPDHQDCVIVDPVTGHELLFQTVPDAKQGKNRVHLDLSPTDRTRDEEIERVLAVGAVELADLRNADGTGWMTLADPEGNEFCICRSAAERQPS